MSSISPYHILGSRIIAESREPQYMVTQRAILAISPPFVLAAHLMCIVASFRVVSLFNAGVAAPVLAWGRHLTRWEVLWTFNLELSPLGDPAQHIERSWIAFDRFPNIVEDNGRNQSRGAGLAGRVRPYPARF